MRLDCVAEYFLNATSGQDIIQGIQTANSKSIPFLIIGGGSNLILPPVYRGLVIFVQIKSLQVKKENNQVHVTAGAGVFLPFMSLEITKIGGTGMEWAGGVPGTIGGAIRGNAGAFNSFIGDYIQKVIAINMNNWQIREFSAKECLFDYRNSFFKQQKEYIILSAQMKFPQGSEDGKTKMKEYLAYRKKNHPSYPSAGSVFKNIEVDKSFFSQFPQANKFYDKGVIPAGFLIEQCNLKGKKKGGAQISEKHANFIINIGGATHDDVLFLINTIKKDIKNKFNISIEEEIEIVDN